MKKRIDIGALTLILDIALLKIERDLPDFFNDLPESSDGPEIDYDTFVEKYKEFKAYGLKLINDMVGELPENPPNPEYNTAEVIKNLRFEHNKSFTWLPRTGAYYGGKVKFVWPELDFEFVVPDARDNYSPKGHGHETYFCGTKNSPEESNGNRASIFGPAGRGATYLEIHYNKR